MSLDPNAPITRLPNLHFIDAETSSNGLFVPNLKAEQIAAIPRSQLTPGGLIFDETAEELLTYTAAGFWLPLLTSGSEIDLTNILCETLQASSTIFASESVTSTNINGTHITCETLLSYETITSPIGNITTVNATDVNVTGVINCANIVSDGIMSIGDLYADDLVSANSFSSNNGYTAGGPSILKDTILDGSLRSDVISGRGPSNDISPITVQLDNGAGVGATGFVRGSITSGTFTLGTGVINGVVNGYIGTFTIPPAFASDFTGSFAVNFMPASITTPATNIYIICNAGLSSPSFLVGVLGTLNNNVQYVWNYQIIGNNKR